MRWFFGELSVTLMLVAGPIELIAAEIRAGRSDFGSAIDRIDRHIAYGGDTGIPFPDEGGAGC
jgi:hypothetical protein